MTPCGANDGEVSNRVPYPIPYVSIANRQAEIMIRIASEFAPASRSSISTPPANERTLFDIVETSRDEA